jgi:hypothetical protein
MDTRYPTSLAHGGSGDLWMKAAASLTDEDRQLINMGGLSEGNVAQAVLKVAQEQEKKSRDKQWSFSFKGKQIMVRDVLKSIISWTEKFNHVVTFAVSMDASGHAALPWACVKFFLVVSVIFSFSKQIEQLTQSQVAGQDIQKYGAMLLGMEFVAREIRFYTIFETVYLNKPFEAVVELKSTLVRTYGTLLQYLAKAYRYYGKHTACRPESTFII